MILYYAHDPMCSYCWAFRPVWQNVKTKLATNHPDINIVYLMGGLAPDSDQSMPQDVRDKVQNAWQHIQRTIPTTKFNYDFWHVQQPRRSTYPSCRAVCATNLLEPAKENAMILAIQQAYYLHALNPSDDETLVDCAVSIGFDKSTFNKVYHSQACQDMFKQQKLQFQQLGFSGFPSLIVSYRDQHINVPIDYNNSNVMLSQIISAAELAFK